MQHVAWQSQIQMCVRSQPALCCCQVVRKKRDSALAQEEAAVKAKKERNGKRKKQEPDEMDPSEAGGPDMTKGDADGGVTASCQHDGAPLPVLGRNGCTVLVPVPSQASHTWSACAYSWALTRCHGCARPPPPPHVPVSADGRGSKHAIA